MTAVSCLVIFFPFLFGDKLAVFNDAGQIIRSWPEEYMTLMVRDLEKD